MTGNHTCPRCKGLGTVTDQRTKLTTDDVDHIRKLATTLKGRDIADLYNVSESTISRILNHQRRSSGWKARR